MRCNTTFFAHRDIDMNKLFKRFLRDESGATAIEYGLIAALISVGIIVGVRSLGSSLSTTLNTLGTTIEKNGK